MVGDVDRDYPIRALKCWNRGLDLVGWVGWVQLQLGAMVVAPEWLGLITIESVLGETRC